MRIGLGLLVVVVVGCSPPVEEKDAGTPPADAGARMDAGLADAGSTDAGGSDAGCIDQDGDGRGEGCALPDCDDGDAALSVLLMGFLDADSDQATVGAQVSVCTGGMLPPTFRATASAAPDCDDTDATRTVSLTGYLDDDGDGATVGDARTFCTGGTLPSSHRATKSAVSDCDDGDATASVSVTGFVDADGDLATVGSSLTFCTNGTLPAGHAAAASALPDCNDADPAGFLSLAGFLDADGDARTVGPAVTICGGSTLPATYRATASPVADCDDTSPVKFAAVTAYADLDWDGVSVATSTTLCGAGILPPGYLAAASTPPDCDDTTAGVAPNAPELPDDGLDNDCANGDATHTAIAANAIAFYVDGAGCPAARSGTASSPFCTITEAMSAIDATPAGAGTVFISAGTYDAVAVPITLDLTLLGGYRNVGGTWSRDLVNNPVRIRPSTGTTALTVPLNLQRLIVDGLTLVSPVGGATAFAIQSAAPVWLSRVNMNPDLTGSATASVGAELDASTTIVGGRLMGFTRKAIDFRGGSLHRLRVFESTLNMMGDTGPVTIVDLGSNSGGGVLRRNQLTSSGGTEVIGVRTPRAPAETTLVGNRVDLLASTTGSTWLRNEGLATLLDNRFAGYSNTSACVGIESVAGPTEASQTTLAANVVSVESLSTDCVAVRLTAGNGLLAHNVLRAAGSMGGDAVVAQGTAATVTLLNNVLRSSRGLTLSATSRVAAYGNTFDLGVNTMVVGTTIGHPAAFDACTWPGCAGAGLTKYASAGFVNVAMHDYRLLDTSVCLNGGADPAAMNLPLFPIFAYAPNGPRPAGVGYDVGIFER